MEWKFVKDTKIESIEEVANTMGVKLNAETMKFIAERNNGRPVQYTFDTEKTKERTIKKILSYNKADTENIYDFINLFTDNVHKLYPIATDSFGNFICINGEDNSVVFLNMENDETEYISDSLMEFEKKLH